ncbi:unnamed protein product [Allacma fusca]|uniref:Major facilitator superfamily (MFS) profile domain-containing protein n=1 Tax=Allacma fusca TaxID=39272 RepID=A0A8J2KEB9_9HEXA|nr:unnamed protein product [Allacma fusca]
MASVVKKVDHSIPKRPPGWGARHTIVILGFWAMCILYALRFNLSIAIVAMVRTAKSESETNVFSYSDEDSHITRTNLSGVEKTCMHLKERFDSYVITNDTTDEGIITRLVKEGRKKTGDMKSQEEDNNRKGEFNWTREQQGIILGSFFWGHVITQIPGGILAQKYGPKWPLGYGILFTSLLAIVTPIAARWSITALIIVRILQGLVGGVVWPAMHLLLGKWAPPDERSKLVSIVYAGPQFGTAAATIACGYLIDWNVFGGWPSAFYVLGGLSLVWFIFWVWLMNDAPKTHPTISPEELAYIEGSIGEQCSGKHVPTPWRAILTSVPVWAILIAHVGEDYGLYTLLTELPTYMKTVLHFNIRENSWMSALPQLVRWLFSIVLTYFADYLIHKKILRVVTVRKLCNTIAHWGAGAALVGVSYLGCDPVMTVVVLTLAVGINGAVNGGCITNHVDIAANHAGILMGITNTAANTCGILAPFVAGLLTNEAATIDRWQIVFFIAAGVYVFNNLVYLLFASGSEQSWNRGEDAENSQKKYANIENVGKENEKEDAKGNVNWVCVNERSLEAAGTEAGVKEDSM